MNYDYFLDTLSENQRNIISFLHQEFLNQPGVVYKMRFKVPFYDYGTWICYLNPKKKDRVELCFLRGKELSNASGLLEDYGRKIVAGIMIEDYNAIPLDGIMECFFEAMDLAVKKKSSK